MNPKDRGQIRRLLTDPVCFDTMVPAHFAMAGHATLIRRAFAGRAKIPGRVYQEIDGLSYSDALVGRLLRPTLFAQSIPVTNPTSLARVVNRMEAWTSIQAVASDPRKNRGEAEAIQVCLDNGGWPLVTQDGHGRRGASAEGLDCYSSVEVLVAMVISGYVPDCATAWGIYLSLESTGLYAAEGWPYDSTGRQRLLAAAGLIEEKRTVWQAKAGS